MTTIPRRAPSLALLALVLLALALVLVPALLLRPFAAQSPVAIVMAFTLRRWAPLLTVLVAVAALLPGWRIWRDARTVWTRGATVVAGLLLVATAWFARQDFFEWMFAPLPDARFTRAANAGFVGPDDIVLTVAQNGDAVAYPVRQLAYHHVVEDAVGKVPIVATY